jgi:hypothetical protein
MSQPQSFADVNIRDSVFGNRPKVWQVPEIGLQSENKRARPYGNQSLTVEFLGWDNGGLTMQNILQLRRYGRPSFRERIADVEQLLAIDDPKPLIIKVSRTERILMELLLKRNMLTREVAWGVLYGHRPDANQPQYRVISTIIHHLRNRLSPHGVEITTEHGTGWYLKDKDREKLEHLLACNP